MKKTQYIIFAEKGRVIFGVNVREKERGNLAIKILGSGVGVFLAGNAVVWAVSDNPKGETWGEFATSYVNHVVEKTANAGGFVMQFLRLGE